MTMYNEVRDPPAHLFKDRMLRSPASKELHAYLSWMLENCPDDLDYLYQASQRYIDHGGGWKEGFDNWRNKLSNSLKRLEGTYD